VISLRRTNGESLEVLAHEWAQNVKILGYEEDWDGSDRPGLPAAIAEGLPSNETPATKTWDMSWEMAECIAGPGESITRWCIGPSAYLRRAR
jgi:hypothetical protein